MSIDWVTVVAQIINFLVLVWLLQRFLYGPITRAMSEREQNIKNRLEETSKIKTQAEDAAKRLEATRLEFERQRDEMTAAMRADVDQLRRDLEEKVRAEIDERREAWGREIEEEKEAFIAELKGQACGYFLALAREALAGLSGKSLNDAIAESFVDRLPELDEERMHRLRKAARHAGSSATVESSFEITPAVKRRITSVIHQCVLPDMVVDYSIADDLICGIRLRIGGQAVSWSIESYLDNLEQRSREMITRGRRDTEREAAQ